MAISTARQFFDDLVTGGVPAIEALVSHTVHETEWLDFKSGEHLKDTSSTWSEAICGFANNQGGVLVWGIDARKDKISEIDAASDVKPVDNPAGLRSRLLELLRNAVEPPIAGVEVRDFARSDGKGFVICFVPESDTKPHRAELLSNKPYKIRIADAFINPSPSLLRSLFFPQSSPRLEIDIHPNIPRIDQDNPPSSVEILYRVSLRNTGLVSAKDIFVVMSTIPHDLTIEPPYGNQIVDSQNGTGIECTRPLHPSSTGMLCAIRHRVQVTPRHQSNSTIYVPSVDRFEARFDVFAADMIPLRLGSVFGDMDFRYPQAKTAFVRADKD